MTDLRHQECCPTTKGFGTQRHEDLKKTVADAFRGSGAEVRLEPASSNGQGRGDVSVFGEATEGKTVFDVNIVSTSSDAALRKARATRRNIQSSDTTLGATSTSRRCLAAILQERFDLKKEKYKGSRFEGNFSPFIISSGGTQHKDVVRYLSRLKKVAPGFADEFIYNTTSLLIKHKAKAFMRAFLPNQSILFDRR